MSELLCPALILTFRCQALRSSPSIKPTSPTHRHQAGTHCWMTWWRGDEGEHNSLLRKKGGLFFSPSEASCKCLLRVLTVVLFEEPGSLVGNTWISGQFKTGVDLNTSVTNAKWRKTKLSAFLQGLEGLFFFFLLSISLSFFLIMEILFLYWYLNGVEK